MDIKTLESFKLSDAIFFHDELNQNLWDENNKLHPEVKNQLILIAKDFIDELGIKDLDVKDITISGSNAAYTYTKHSDLDLHILVDMSKLPDNEVYKELFTAKKNLYNDSHDITVHGVPVELYVQDSNEPVVSLGEYSILQDKWLKIPTKRRANFDQTITKQKYDKLLHIIKKALKSKDLEQIENIITTIKRYRKAGLDKGGEFGPENLAYKALRTQGYIDKLYQLRDKLHSIDLSIEENILYKDPKQLIDLYLRRMQGKDLSKYSLTKILQNLPYNNLDNAINFLVKKHQVNPTDIVWQPSDGTNEDYDPNGPPPGPEFKPTMPAGTVRVDVSDVYDWYKLGQHISNMKGLGKHDFGKGPPSTVMAFGDEDLEHQYIKALQKTGLSTTDIDPFDPKQPKGIPRQKVDPTYNVNEAKVPSVRQQIINDVKKNGGNINEYFVRFTDSDKLGFSAKQGFGQTPDVDDPKFDVDYIGTGQGRRALWFYPLSYYLKDDKPYASEQPYVWLVRLKPNAWLQKVKHGDNKVVQAPEGKQRVGMLRMSLPPAAIFFTHGFDVVGKYYDYAGQHQRHGEVKGKPTPSFFDRVRGLGEDETLQFAGEKTPAINPYGGLKDRQFRGAISEMPDTSGPVGVQPGGWRTYRPKVDEGFDQPYPLKWEKSAYGDYDALAKLPDGTNLSIMFNNEYKKNWMVEFYRNNSQAVTGEGDAQRIFATVLHAIQQFIKKKKPASLFFSAVKEDDPTGSRTKLYDRLVQRFATGLGYTVQKREEPGSNSYKLKRIENTNKGVAEGASGYIPSNAEKNDPRFKTALTVDIKPDTMKKDAKKFGNKISRAGIPPTLKPSGKF
jgi:hypothetical protein